VRQRRDPGARNALDFVNPIDLIVELAIWRLRSAGRTLITGIVLMGAVIVITIALFVPLILAGLLIAVFELTVEPYRWIGSLLILVAFVVGIATAMVMAVRTVRRGLKLIDLAESVLHGHDDSSAAEWSPVVRGRLDREAWVASVRALDARHAEESPLPTVAPGGSGSPPPS